LKKKGGIIETGMEANARKNRAEGKATMAGKKKVYKTGGAVKKYNNGGPTPSTPATKPSSEPSQKKSKLTPVSENSTNNPMSQDKFMAKKGGAMSKFKTMAAAGKKKMMGGKKC